jgi:hypothetical protein
MSLEPSDHEPLAIPKDSRLYIYLNEYNKLKDEQIARIVLREHFVYVTLGVFGGVFSYALHADHHYAFLVIPLVCIILGWMYLTVDEKVSAIGEYLRRDLTEKLAPLVGMPAEQLLGWEIAHRSDKYRRPRKWIQLFIDLLTFILSGVFALAAFLWYQTELNNLFLTVLVVEGFSLMLLMVWMVMTTDLKVGR